MSTVPDHSSTPCPVPCGRLGLHKGSSPAQAPVSKHLAFICQGCISSCARIYNWS